MQEITIIACKVCGSAYADHVEECPACKMLYEYMERNAEIFNCGEDEPEIDHTLASMQGWFDAELRMKTPPVFVAAVYKLVVTQQ